MQQPGFNDTQPLHMQQYMMLKQLQEFQRQQQLGDPLNRYSVSPGTQLPPLINGTPVHNWMQPVVPSKVMFPQEIDASLNGTPVTNASQNQYTHFQAQSSGFGNASNAFPGLQMKSNFGQLPVEGQGNLEELNAGQEQMGGSSLDPLEAKILYNMDDGNIWDAFGSQTDAAATENADSNAFQCGTWSALMQSAVAESDTGVQEEWSGLTFQNPELSTDNVMVTGSTAGSTFPGLHQPEMQLLAKQRENISNDSPRESTVNYNSQKPAVQNDNTKMFEKHKQGASSNDPTVTVNSFKGQEKSQNQLYSQASSSRGFGLGLAPPSQKAAYLNGTLMPQALNILNSRHDFGETTPARHESGFPGPSSLSSYVNLQGTSTVKENQSQIHPSQSSPMFLPGSMSQTSPLNQMVSHRNSVSQPYSDLGISHHSNMSGMALQAESSASPYNVWRNVPSLRPPLSSFPSSIGNNNRSSSSSAPHVPVGRSAEVGTSSNIPDASLGGMPLGKEPISDVATPNYGLPVIHAQQRQNDEPTNQQKYSHVQQVQATLVSSPLENQVAVTMPKKRKFMAIELVPWHNEVTQQPKRLQTMSVAEQDWAQAANRLIEKVEVIEALHRSKRRLVLTTQLVQQLLRPPPASVFSADAATNNDIILYSVSRLSLGDACSLSHCSVKDIPKNSNTNSEKPKSECSTEKHLKVANSFSNRIKRLEDEFERLDKTVSIAIIRAEIAELERFAVINRFAKFHVRGKTDATPSSSGAGPQRRIIAIPVPQYIPEGVQCLSL